MAAGRNEGDLRARLTEAAADGLSSARTIDHADRDEGLRFLLGQIAATVMGRRIAVAFDGTDRLVLDVAGQRLSHLRVLDADGDVEIPMRAGDTEAQEAVADLLGELCDGSKRIAVATGPLGHAGAAARGGISATHLAKMLGFAAPEPMPNDPDALASALFDFAGDAVIAAMQVEDRALVPVSGQADELAALETASRDWVADLIDDEGALARHLAGEGVLFLDAADGGSQSIMLAAFGSTRILALVESRALPRLYGFWDRL